MGYADNKALCEAAYTNLRKACHAYEQAFMNGGLELNYKKTEWMVVAPPSNCNVRAPAQVMRLHQGNINRVQKFKYLVVWLTASRSEKLNNPALLRIRHVM